MDAVGDTFTLSDDQNNESDCHGDNRLSLRQCATGKSREAAPHNAHIGTGGVWAYLSCASHSFARSC